MSNAKVGGSSSVAFLVGIVLSLFDSFGIFVVLWLFGQCLEFVMDLFCTLILT